MLRESLSTLPPTLDQTYDRILSAIRKEDSDYAIRILQWLTFSGRPLTIREVAEVVAIDVERDPAFDRDEVLEDPLEALNMCSSLVTITDSVEETITLAHYSVKEYLVSDRIKRGPASQYSMQPAQCHSAITKGCLNYLLQLPHLFRKDDIELFPLAVYSARFWASHLREAGNAVEALSRLATRLLSIKQPAYRVWVHLYTWGVSRRAPILWNNGAEAEPLYYASYLGLSLVVQLLLGEGADINALALSFVGVINAASLSGHEQVVKLLLNAGADISYDTAVVASLLQAAILSGHEGTVKTLMDAGANVNSDALETASLCGHENVVRILLSEGAQATAKALQAASAGGYDKIVRMLIEAGAEPLKETGTI
jgi:hypothetical protein